MLRESKFINDIFVSKRGFVKVAASQLPGRLAGTVTKDVVKKVLKTFEKSPDVPKKVLQQYQQRAELDDNSKQVAQDFFKDLNKTRKSQSKMCLVTAMSLRQIGIFKTAGRDVYEDLETGDFWKISEDKQHVMRLFKEDERGVSDKKACLNIVDQVVKETIKKAIVKQSKINEIDVSDFEEKMNDIIELTKDAFKIVQKSEDKSLQERARSYWYNTIRGCVDENFASATMYDMSSTKDSLEEESKSDDAEEKDILSSKKAAAPKSLKVAGYEFDSIDEAISYAEQQQFKKYYFIGVDTDGIVNQKYQGKVRLFAIL